MIGPRYSSDDLNYGQSGNKKQNVERLNDMLFSLQPNEKADVNSVTFCINDGFLATAG